MTADGPEARGTGPGGDIWIEGNEDAGALLRPTLIWAGWRIDSRFGACAVLSGRLEPIARAWGRVAWTAPEPSSEAGLREAILAPRQVLALAERLEGDPSLPSAIEPNRDELTDGLLAGLESAGLSVPHVLALRSRGRLSGVVMLSRPATSALDSGAVMAALRRVQPLVEIAVDPDSAVTRHPSSADVPHSGDLTPRERSIVELVVSGAGNAEIAAELGIAKTTVRNHMSRILRKFGVRSRAQLIAIYVSSEEAGQVDQGPLHEGRDFRMNLGPDR